MKKSLALIPLLCLLAACTDPYDLNTKRSERTLLCVEAPLTDMPSRQVIRLSESVDYDDPDDVPAVSNAIVTITDGTEVFTFTEEKDRPGYYDSPKDFHCSSGNTYQLDIECTLSTGKHGRYKAVSKMTDPGFDIDKIDYMHLGTEKDSTWVLGVWGKDKPETHYFLITTAVNGIVSPTTSLLERSMLMPDTFFNNSYVSGFPIAYLYQNAHQMEKYGDCAKPLKRGDVVSMVVYTMTKDYYDFVMALSSASSSISIPIISSQPANIPTNIEGDDATGFFAICPVTLAHCIIDDPFRSEFRK